MQIRATLRALAVHTALECVGLQESRLVRQWSEAVFGRWPRVMHQSGGAVTPAMLPSGSYMSDLLTACTRSLNPRWCCFPLCGTKITHCIYWLSLTPSAFPTPKLFTLFCVGHIFLDSWRAMWTALSQKYKSMVSINPEATSGVLKMGHHSHNSNPYNLDHFTQIYCSQSIWASTSI